MASTSYGAGWASGANGGVAPPKQPTHQQQNQADKGHADGKRATGK